MLKSCVYNDKHLHFVNDSADPSANAFTVVVGRNGTGKSRLLSKIVNASTKLIELRNERHDSFLLDGPYPHAFPVELDNIPSRVIATSTSPFDRFPIDIQRKKSGFYNYLGLRGVNTNNFGLSFLSRVLGALIRSINRNPQHAQSVSNVLNYLGYAPFIEARLQYRSSDRELIKHPDALALLRERNEPRAGYFGWGRNYDFSRKGWEDEVIQAIDYFRYRFENHFIDIHIGHNGVFDRHSPGYIPEEFATFMDLGLIRLRSVSLQKLSVEQPFEIKDASSGEQSVVTSFLGIAGHIQDGALICIDEPEICLHPEWQERYIDLLMSTFQEFSGCHFVIATHSPQIISQLQDKNCFVLDIETGKTFNATQLNHRSADFQLAQLFRAPGYKNEYLSRELIAALAELGAGKGLSLVRIQEIRDLLQLEPMLDDKDPVKRLAKMVALALQEVTR